MKNILVIFLCIAITETGLKAQDFVINELMTANVSAVMDPTYYNFSEWLEIYNPTAQIKSLNGYYLSNDPTNYKLWKIPNLAVPAHGYTVIWFDKLGTGTHASFRIRSNRELLILSNTSGSIVDSVRIEFPFANCTYGRIPDGSSTWAYFTAATQGKTNNSTPVYSQAPRPEFNLKGGIYKGNQHIVLSSPNTGYTIRYTTDGSEPVASSPVYSSEIVLSKTTTVKARSFANNTVPSDVAFNTYFINEHQFTIPVVSIATDDKYLWDNTIGIYTDGNNGITGNCSSVPRNWNQDWERPATVEYYNPDGTRIINYEAGIKIAGACSRGNAQKSFSVYFRDKYGADHVQYPLFLSKQADKFNSFMLRNSGNDNNRTMFHDAMMETLIIGEMDVDYTAYTPSIVYLNDEYWGILNTREKINEGYLYSNYGLDEDSIDLLETNLGILAGSSSDYSALISYVTNNDLSIGSNYQYVKDHMDVKEYMNYLIAQIYSDNTDWPGNNIKYWKPKRAGGKWRWILFDMDFGFGLYSGNPADNTLTFALATDGPSWPNPPWSTLLFRRLLTSEEFTEQFIDKFNTYIYSIYNPARVNRIIDSLKQKIADEMPYHFNRWGGSMSDWENNINVARNFAAQRPDYMMQYLQDYFSLGLPYHVAITSNISRKSFVSVNDITINDTIFEGKYFGGRSMRLKALESKDYKFKKWNISYSNTQNLTLLSKNSVWKYLDDNSVPASTWKSLSFNESGWKSGNGQLGYGEGDETTTLDYGGDANNKYITYYFRKKVNISDPTGISSLTINLLLDDGVVVYLNGNEIMRYNMPDGTITGSTFASSAIANENVYYTFNLVDFGLVAGNNVIAVELHQNSITSSDLGFDMSVTATKTTGMVEETQTSPTYSLDLGSNLECSVVAEFEPTGAVDNLFINEICAKNTTFPDEENEYDDWLELYNAGDDTIDLAGMYFTNSLDVPEMFKMASDASGQTLMLPHSFKVLWADGQSGQGYLHLDFTLDKDGGEVGIGKISDNGFYYIDTLVYPGQKTNYTYGRYGDGTGRWFQLSDMTPGESNVYTGLEEVEDFSLTMLYPNPANNLINIAFNNPTVESVSLTIYSSIGKEMIKMPIDAGTSRSLIDISTLPAGIYVVTISNELSTTTLKLVKN
jgi:hypothetical protein